ncbi:hypothetical protein [Microbacterium sp. Yaish 1]|uniref:hypothetical protein n=1 Tax=Microbacterium sp. Yaish 1 TaxID=2025014 RepID=UPI000B940678|nr:hypothetical protein [Microbacterium sp. Yaish 1]OYC98210.1 hypothetical protein CI089_06900 [Microbacterium sp. Yaish 1]
MEDASDTVEEFRRQELRFESELNGIVEYGCDLFRGEARELGIWLSGRDRVDIDQRVAPLVEDVLRRLPALVALIGPRPPSELASIAVSPGRAALTFWEDGVNNEFTAVFLDLGADAAQRWSFVGFDT